MHETLQILLYALIAAASPTTVMAVLVVLLSSHGRANGIAFGAGFLFGSVAAFVTVFFVGSTISNQDKSSDRSYVELVVGLLLIAVALRARRPQKPMESGRRAGIEAVFEKLEQVRPKASFSFGVALGVGAKRLVITAIAATSLALAGLNHAEDTGLAILYVIVGGLAVWPLVAVYLIAGKRAEDWIVKAKDWLTANTRKVVFYSSTVLGLALIGDALVELL
jgi:threonine/homoserine/homoserine lactone efflux protein